MKHRDMESVGPLRYKLLQEFRTYEISEKPEKFSGTEAGIMHSINENMSEKLSARKGHYDTYDHFCGQQCCLAFVIETNAKILNLKWHTCS